MIDITIANNIIQRMNKTNDYIIANLRRYFWANNNRKGYLIKGYFSEEVYTIQILAIERPNMIKHNNKIIKL